MSASVRFFFAGKILPLFADIEARGDIARLPKDGDMLASHHLDRLDSLVVYLRSRSPVSIARERCFILSIPGHPHREKGEASY